MLLFFVTFSCLFRIYAYICIVKSKQLKNKEMKASAKKYYGYKSYKKILMESGMFCSAGRKR